MKEIDQGYITVATRRAKKHVAEAKYNMTSTVKNKPYCNQLNNKMKIIVSEYRKWIFEEWG